MKGADPAGRAMGMPVDLRVHPRLDRARRGRPDAPADRAARQPARDARTSTWCARRTRTRPRWPGSSRIERHDGPTALVALAPGPADARSGRRARRRDRARRLRAAREPASPTCVIVATGSRCMLAEAPPTCSRPTGSPTRVVSMPCLERFASRTTPTATQRAAAGVPRARRSRPPRRSAGTAGSATTATVIGMTGFGASAPAEGALRALRVHARRTSPTRAPGVAARRGAQNERRRMVNQRLAALTAAGTSVWLDQIRRNLIESGELAAAGRRGLAARRDLEPVDLREGDPRLRRLRRAIDEVAATSRARRARRSTSDLAINDVQLAADVLRPVWDALGRRRRLRLARGRARPGARHRRHARSAAPALGARVDRPNVMIKIPGTDEGVPAIERADLRGHQRQRDAAVRRRGRTRRSPRPTSAGLERAPRGGRAARRHRQCRVVLRLARGHRGRQAPRGLAAAGQGRRGQRRSRYQRFKEIFAGERWQRLADAGAQRAAPAVGLDRREGPGLSARPCTSTSWSGPRHGQHDAVGHAGRLRASTARSPADAVTSGATPSSCTDARRSRASTWTTSPTRCSLDGLASFSKDVRQADRAARAKRKRGPRGPARSTRTSLAVAGGRRSLAARDEAGDDVARRDLAQGPHASGAARSPRSTTASAG